MELYLLQEGLWNLVTGKEQRCVVQYLDSPHSLTWRGLEHWDNRDQRAAGIILAGLKGDRDAMVMREYSKTAAELWTNIQLKYGKTLAEKVAEASVSFKIGEEVGVQRTASGEQKNQYR